MKNKTNIYPIENLDQLSYNYRLFEMVGLNESIDEFEENIQRIVRKLSFILRHPVTTTRHQGKVHLVIKDDPQIAQKVPQDFNLVRNKIFLKPIDETLFLDFENYTEDTKEICLRFLNFDIQSQVNKHPDLWQPGAGKPYYRKSAKRVKGVNVFNGFIARVVELERGFGIAIDTTKKYVSANPLKTNMTKDDFKRFKGKHFVYHHQNWYDIKLEEYCDQTVSQYTFERDGRDVSLIDDLRNQIRKPHSTQLANLPDDASVLFYRSNKSALLAVPAGLCYQIYDTEDLKNQWINEKPTSPPHLRFFGIKNVRRSFMNNLKFGKVTLRLSSEPLEVMCGVLKVPDFEFGNGKVLSLDKKKDVVSTSIKSLGRDRKRMILDSNIGFYSIGELDRQFFVMPKSIYDSMGKDFLEALKLKVNQMYKTEGGYNPQVITYDDRNEQNYVNIGLNIVSAVRNQLYGQSGYGVVMIPDYKRRKREHDKLAALVVQQLMDSDIHVGIMHTNTIQRSYAIQEESGTTNYAITPSKQGKLDGYITNVAINKVLLTNEKWPFILNEPLKADLTIGIDVKHHTAGFTFIGNQGKNIRTVYHQSKDKEKLKKQLVHLLLKKHIKEEAEHFDYDIRKIVIHRDGRLFKTEREGIILAIDELRNEMALPNDVSVTFLEIPKKSVSSVRLFHENYKGRIYNPNIGSYFMLNSKEAVLCSTGAEFPRPGTTNPLSVKYDSGAMPFRDVLEDLYRLTTLAYTRPEDCTRFPLTIKITDRKLGEVASQYDEEMTKLLTDLKIEIS